MSNRKFRRQADRRSKREARRTGHQVDAAGHAPGPHGASHLSFALFALHAPVASVGRVHLWSSPHGGGALHVAACAVCGERLELEGRRLEIPDGTSMGELMRCPAIAAFQEDHAFCAAVPGEGLPACQESNWRLPTGIPAEIRFWADDALDDVWTAAPTYSVVCRVLLLESDGMTTSHIFRVQEPPAGMCASQTPDWVRSRIDAEVAIMDAELLALVVVVCQVSIDSDGHPVVTGILCVASDAGVHTAEIDADAGMPIRHEGLRPLLIWTPAATPSPVFDGLLTVSSLG